jgi:CRP-like cAMP-binding protein
MAASATEPQLQALHRALQLITTLDEASFTSIRALLRRRDVACGEHLLRSGELARSIYFVCSGLLREYYVDLDGHCATRRFCAELEFSGSLADLLTGGPAMVSIEALEVTTVLHLPWTEFDVLTQAHPAWQMVARRLAEGLYMHKMQREFEMLTLSAAERYARFVGRHAALQVRMPQHLVASYLGMTPVHLSRLRRASTPPPTKAKTPGKR